MQYDYAVTEVPPLLTAWPKDFIHATILLLTNYKTSEVKSGCAEKIQEADDRRRKQPTNHHNPADY